MARPVMRMCYTHRRLLSQVAMHLANEGKNDKAAEVLALSEKEIPTYNVPSDFQSGSIDMARTYSRIGKKAEAAKLIGELWQKSSQYMQWYCSLSPSRFAGAQQDCMMHLYIMQQLVDIASQTDEELGEKLGEQLEQIYNIYHARGGSFAI